jgi:prophage regulatory protein
MTSILRMPMVKAETGHRSHASIYNAIKAGTFTKPVQIGQRSVGWPSDEVQAINAARIAGKSDADIRELVNKLHLKRLGVTVNLNDQVVYGYAKVVESVGNQK